MTSVVIAAHNEAGVVGRCLDTLLAEATLGEFDVTVVANGCTDDTARVAAARPGVRVVELAQAGKAAALNAGDDVAVGFPRVYLDADVVVGTDGLRALAAAVGGSAPARPGVALAATARRDLDVAGRPLPVRAYFAIQRRLPALRDGLFGRGVIALSARGRDRFERFPGLMADDLFLDSLFTADEKRQVESVSARVVTPRRTADLIRRLSRVRGANAALRAARSRGEIVTDIRPAARLSWLRDVVVPRPWLAPAAACYVGITVLAAASARRAGEGAVWGRDESSRMDNVTPAGRSGRPA